MMRCDAKVWSSLVTNGRFTLSILKQVRLSEFVCRALRNDWRNHARAKVRRTTRRARATVRRVRFGFKDVCSCKNILQIFEFADAIDDEQQLYENLVKIMPSTRGA